MVIRTDFLNLVYKVPGFSQGQKKFIIWPEIMNGSYIAQLKQLIKKIFISSTFFDPDSCPARVLNLKV